MYSLSIRFSIRFRPLDVLPFDQIFDAFLDDGRTGLKPLVQLFHNLSHQLVMVMCLPAFHNTHHTRFNLMLSILIDLAFGFIAFWFSFTLSGRGLLDLDSVKL